MWVYIEYILNYITYSSVHLELQFAFMQEAHFYKKKKSTSEKSATCLNLLSREHGQAQTYH